jgi:ribosomal protein S18 acetylase RimI-like enzyme
VTALMQVLPEDGQAVAALVERNAREWLLAMGSAGGGTAYADDQIQWIVGGSPIDYHNAVVHAQLTSADADRKIDAFVQAARAAGVPASWHLSAFALPADLEDRLLAKGFRYDGAETLMALELADLPPVPVVEGVTVREVLNVGMLLDWERTLAVDFGAGEAEAKWVTSVYRRLRFGEGAAFRHFVAYRDGHAVGTASVFLGSESAGIYFVATIPDARRQGIGGAITLAALQVARDAGYGVAVLGSSQMAESVYWRLGFRPYGRVKIYTVDGQ